MYETMYSTETVLAKVRGELKDTEVNSQFRPGSTIMENTAVSVGSSIMCRHLLGPAMQMKTGTDNSF